METTCQGINIKANSACALEIDIKTYLVKIIVSDYRLLPGQYLKLSCGESQPRFFSIASWRTLQTPWQQIEINLFISFIDDSSVSRKIISDIQSGKPVYVSTACGTAYWRPSQYGNVLIASGSGYGYIRGILQHILNEQNKMPVLLIWVHNQDDGFFDREYIYEISKSYENFHFKLITREYTEYDSLFLGNLCSSVHDLHLSSSNFYIGSGKIFFNLIKKELSFLGVDSDRVISDNLS